MAAALVSGFLAIAVLLRFLRTRSTDVFVVYRVILAARRARRLARLRHVPMEVMKQLRQRAIRDLVDQRPIRTQQELAGALRERGFRTTQATISRDVAELGLIKVSREGTQAYALPPRLIEAETSGEDRLRKLLADLPVEFHEAGCCSSSGRCRARLTRSRPPSIERAGRRSPARSPATTRSSWRSRIAARSSGSSAA